MLNEHNCENCAHYPICARTVTFQRINTELKTIIYFEDCDGSSRLIPDVDWVRLTLTCSFFDPKNHQKL